MCVLEPPEPPEPPEDGQPAPQHTPTHPDAPQRTPMPDSSLEPSKDEQPAPQVAPNLHRNLHPNDQPQPGVEQQHNLYSLHNLEEREGIKVYTQA